MNNPNTATRKPCSRCDRTCRTISGVCGPCQGIGVDNDGLTGGRWVVVAGIRRWKTWTDAERAERTRRALQLCPPSREFVAAQAARRRLWELVRSAA